jgi:hypothetical protein
LFVGDEWAEDHHDVELVDEHGKVLAKKRFPEGLAGVTRLHALIAEQLPDPGRDPDTALDPGIRLTRPSGGLRSG